MPGDRDVFRAPIGTHDVLPPESDRWQALVAAFAGRARRAGFGMLVTPIFEHVEVVQKLGSTTDVVSKEMYDFDDKGGRHLALRADGTASVARAFAQHQPLTPWKVWYVAPNFRYERPQKGRYRQHWQAGAALLGAEMERAEVNPLRILDSKREDWQDMIEAAPQIGDYLTNSAAA